MHLTSNWIVLVTATLKGVSVILKPLQSLWLQLVCMQIVSAPTCIMANTSVWICVTMHLKVHLNLQLCGIWSCLNIFLTFVISARFFCSGVAPQLVTRGSRCPMLTIHNMNLSFRSSSLQPREWVRISWHHFIFLLLLQHSSPFDNKRWV